MRAVLIGEAMLEVSQHGSGCRLGYGGDTLNTAIHLARAGLTTAYLTAIGSDPLSARLKESWAAEGLDTSLVLVHPDRTTGLYAIATDASGERSFTYWRDTSAAREMFGIDGADIAKGEATHAGLFAFSLISLAILPDADRLSLIELASQVRKNGGKVAFDGNYRPRLWAGPADAIEWRDQAIAVADIGLPTLEDEVALGMPVDARQVAAHWQALGCQEIVVKLGPAGCLLPDGTLAPPPQVLQPVDTSGAGDAFNGGYLAARMRGESIRAAARAGQALAGWAVMRRGGVPPRDLAAPYA